MKIDKRTKESFSYIKIESSDNSLLNNTSSTLKTNYKITTKKYLSDYLLENSLILKILVQ